MVGYYLFAADGGLFAFGSVAPLGRAAPLAPGSNWIALSGWRDREHLLALSSDGTVSTLGADGGAPEAAQLGGARAIGVEATPSAKGYWLLDEVGGVFCFGEALFHGSIPGLGSGASTAPIVRMAATPTGLGYWILDMVGGVYSFGDAEFFGSVPGLSLLSQPAAAIDLFASVTGRGYCILEADGNVRAFGDAPDAGPADPRQAIDAVGFAPAGLHGYVVVDRRGLVYPVGDAPMYGSTAGLALSAPIVDVFSVG